MAQAWRHNFVLALTELSETSVNLWHPTLNAKHEANWSFLKHLRFSSGNSGRAIFFFLQV